MKKAKRNRSHRIDRVITKCAMLSGIAYPWFVLLMHR